MVPNGSDPITIALDGSSSYRILYECFCNRIICDRILVANDLPNGLPPIVMAFHGLSVGSAQSEHCIAVAHVRHSMVSIEYLFSDSQRTLIYVF